MPDTPRRRLSDYSKDDLGQWRSDVNTRLVHTDNAVGELKVGLAETHQGLRDLIGAVHGLRQDLGALFKDSKREFPFATVIAFASLLLVLAGGYATLMMVPIRDQQNSNTSAISILGKNDMENAQWHGHFEGMWEERSKRLETLLASFEDLHKTVDKNERGDSFAFGRQEAYEGRLDRLSQRLEKLGERTYNAKP